jgi:hypothetical protein
MPEAGGTCKFSNLGNYRQPVRGADWAGCPSFRHSCGSRNPPCSLSLRERPPGWRKPRKRRRSFREKLESNYLPTPPPRRTPGSSPKGATSGRGNFLRVPAPAAGVLSLNEQGKDPKELAPEITHVPEIEPGTIRFQACSLAARLLGAALTGHPCPGRAGSPSLASPACRARGNSLRRYATRRYQRGNAEQDVGLPFSLQCSATFKVIKDSLIMSAMHSELSKEIT